MTSETRNDWDNGLSDDKQRAYEAYREKIRRKRSKQIRKDTWEKNEEFRTDARRFTEESHTLACQLLRENKDVDHHEEKVLLMNELRACIIIAQKAGDERAVEYSKGAEDIKGDEVSKGAEDSKGDEKKLDLDEKYRTACEEVVKKCHVLFDLCRLNGYPPSMRMVVDTPPKRKFVAYLSGVYNSYYYQMYDALAHILVRNYRSSTPDWDIHSTNKRGHEALKWYTEMQQRIAKEKAIRVLMQSSGVITEEDLVRTNLKLLDALIEVLNALFIVQNIIERINLDLAWCLDDSPLPDATMPDKRALRYDIRDYEKRVDDIRKDFAVRKYYDELRAICWNTEPAAADYAKASQQATVETSK